MLSATPDEINSESLALDVMHPNLTRIPATLYRTFPIIGPARSPRSPNRRTFSKGTGCYAGSFSVRTSRVAYAATDNAVSTTTTFPLVLNRFWFSPLSPISEKNC